jgi:predicted DsbA family dithiol-disulfide isomerase
LGRQRQARAGRRPRSHRHRGLDAAELRAALEEHRYDAVIDENRRAATSVGIDAIPAHVFGRHYLVLGAQPYEVLRQVVDRLNAVE